MNWPHGDPDAVVRALLARAPYSTLHAPLASDRPTLFDRILMWIGERLHDLLQPLSGPVARALLASAPAGAILGIALVGCALAALGYCIFRFVLAYVRAAQPQPDEASSIAAARSATNWKRMAVQAQARGDYRLAITALFAAALVALDARNVVTFDGARAPGEYRRIVRAAHSPAAESFDSLTDRFVHALYGAQPVTVRDFEGANGAFAQLEAALA